MYEFYLLNSYGSNKQFSYIWVLFAMVGLIWFTIFDPQVHCQFSRKLSPMLTYAQVCSLFIFERMLLCFFTSFYVIYVYVSAQLSHCHYIVTVIIHAMLLCCLCHWSIYTCILLPYCPYTIIDWLWMHMCIYMRQGLAMPWFWVYIHVYVSELTATFRNRIYAHTYGTLLPPPLNLIYAVSICHISSSSDLITPLDICFIMLLLNSCFDCTYISSLVCPLLHICLSIHPWIIL